MDANTKKEVEGIAQKVLENGFEQMYRKIATKYGVADVPLHKHNGIDAPAIPLSSLDGFITLPANGSGVLAPVNIGFPDGANGQYVDTPTGIVPSPPSLYVPKIPIIYGHGVGTWSQFNGGDAPNGSILFFHNTAIATQIWIRMADTWYGFDSDHTI